MADAYTGSPQESRLSQLAKDQWLFPKVVAAISLCFVILVVILSPSIYLPSLKNTPEALSEKAERLADEKRFEDAIDLYQQVLRFEAPRLAIFARAERNIQKIKELMRLREKEGTEDASIEEVGGVEGEEGAEGEETSGEEEEPGKEEKPDAKEKPEKPKPPPLKIDTETGTGAIKELDKEPDAKEKPDAEPDLRID